MAINALFDKHRVNGIRKALAEGKFIAGTKREMPLSEPPLSFQKEAPADNKPNALLGSEDLCPICWENSDAENLLLLSLHKAIKEGDLSKASAAIDAGANIHKPGIVLITTPSATVYFTYEKITPLNFARRENQFAIVALLQSKGAKD
jgi:hypothetical protein